jgi:hypothetical protein
MRAFQSNPHATWCVKLKSRASGKRGILQPFNPAPAVGIGHTCGLIR